MATSNALTDFAEQKVIEALLKNISYVGGATVYVGLATAAATPESAGGLTEVTTSGTAYARQPVVASSGWSAGGQVAGVYEVSNAADIVYAVATADYGTVTHAFIADAVSGGNVLIYVQLDTAKLVQSGDQFKLLTGNLKVNAG